MTPTDTPAAGSGHRILVVDDTPANLRLLAFLLEKKGYELKTAEDAPSALALLAEWRPRLILLDLQLPGMGGLELAAKLKADPATRDLLIVAVTAFAMKGDLERAMAAGCDSYVTKPIDTRALPALVAELIANQDAAAASGSASPP
jgi:CheY-like chemotaxis protein